MTAQDLHVPPAGIRLKNLQSTSLIVLYSTRGFFRRAKPAGLSRAPVNAAAFLSLPLSF